MTISKPDALIVGGGLAGGALAARLADAGRGVVLLERETGPHDKVCGEFLSREAVLYLTELGLDLPALGAQRIERIRLEAAGYVTETKLPFSALSLSRRVLDAALLRRAANAGADIRMDAKVLSLSPGEGGWQARLHEGGMVQASNAFLATGKHDLKDWHRPEGQQGDLIGFKLYWRLTEAETQSLSGHVELMLFRGGYAGLSPVEGGIANLCLLVRRSRFAALGQSWDSLLESIRMDCPLLDRRLTGAEAGSERPLAIYAIPYGHIARASDQGADDGLWRIGDQAAVIPSFSGDGMSIALHSARLAAAVFQEGGTAALYQRQMAQEIGGQVRLATFLSLFSMAPLGRGLIGLGAAMAPGMMVRIARATRVPASALQRAGLNGVSGLA